MSREFPLAIALSCLTGGCFGAHGVDDPPPVVDPPQWTDCYDALYGAAADDTCDFSGMCGDFGGCEPGPTQTAMCVRGRVRFVERICSPPQWIDCEEFRTSGWGTTGDGCDVGSFGTCADPLIDCCGTSYSCEAGVVRSDSYCADGCVDPPLCDDYLPPPPETPLCGSSAECTEEAYCVPPGTPVVCGPCFEPIDGCASDADCADSDVCVSETPLCSCGGSSNVCRPRCHPGGCADGFTCSTGGTCDAVSCTSDFVCGSNQRCVGLGGGVDEHGCGRLRCGATSDCECGACVEGYCYSGLGTCELPPA